MNSADRATAMAVLVLFVLPSALIGACFVAAGTGQFDFLGGRAKADHGQLLLAILFIAIAIGGLFWVRDQWRN